MSEVIIGNTYQIPLRFNIQEAKNRTNDRYRWKKEHPDKDEYEMPEYMYTYNMVKKQWMDKEIKILDNLSKEENEKRLEKIELFLKERIDMRKKMFTDILKELQKINDITMEEAVTEQSNVHVKNIIQKKLNNEKLSDNKLINEQIETIYPISNIEYVDKNAKEILKKYRNDYTIWASNNANRKRKREICNDCYSRNKQKYKKNRVYDPKRKKEINDRYRAKLGKDKVNEYERTRYYNNKS